MKKIMLCLFTVFALVGCNKEKPTLKTSAKQSSAVAKTHTWESLCDVPNSSNEYDFVGSEHNRIMALCEASGTSDMSLSEVYRLVDATIEDEYRVSWGTMPAPAEEIATPVLKAFESESSLRGYINSLPTSELQKSELNNLFTIMLDYDGTNLCETIDNIKTFENELIRKHSKSEIETVLISSSVGRYSLAYWHEREDRGPSMPMGFWKKFIIGAADALGGTAGGVGGAPGGPFGIIGGAIGGAVGASSGAAALWKIFSE
ncbi:MAG: hypothetical protein JNL13_03825 [Chitinophagaceae bacterium]|nr:hypothetical protein [Chitinophagaceae bacterium]